MIPYHEWLDEAKLLHVGQSKRVHHGAEKRPNMLIQNTPSAYKVWCWHCNTGAIVRKQYSRVCVERSSDTRDYEFVSIGELLKQDRQKYKDLVLFLQSKGVSLVLLEPYIIGFDNTSNRIVLQCGTHANAALLGRAIYAASPAKWLTYKRGVSAYVGRYNKTVIVVEDNFSALKVHHVMQCDTLALNGTKLTREALTYLLGKHVVLHLDMDAAGQKGSAKIHKQLNAVGVCCTVIQAPEPKELNQKQIRDLYGRLFTAAVS